MSERWARQNKFYCDAGAGWNLKRTPCKAWAKAWSYAAEEYAGKHQVGREEGKRMACADHLQTACRRLDERTRSRWDLPAGFWFSEDLVDRLWRLESEIEDAADFFNLLEESEMPKPAPRVIDMNAHGVQCESAKTERPALEAYSEALNERGIYTSGSAFPRRAYWPEDDIRAYADALELARWTLEALKERHRRGEDPRSPLTLGGRELVEQSLKRQPTMTADELKAGLAPYAPQDEAAADQDQDQDQEGE